MKPVTRAMGLGLLAVVVTAGAPWARAAAQLPGQTTRELPGQTVIDDAPLVLPSTMGADLYRFYCSNCHGADAKGRRARGATLTPPPDLTTLSRANGGVFPRERVRETILRGGPEGSPHGPEGMPVWGAIFRGLDPSEVIVQIRISNLVQYLESIQEP